MDKVLTTEEIYDTLDLSELGVMCVKDEFLLEILTKNVTFNDRIYMRAYDDRKFKIIRIAKVLYSEYPGYSAILIKTRSDAIYELFDRWTAAGYNKNKSVDLFKCRAFKKYYESIDYLKSDYIVFDENPTIKIAQYLGQMSIEDYPEYMPDTNK